jgi:hypothetical protein
MSWLKKLTVADIERHNQRVRVGEVVSRVRQPKMFQVRENKLFKPTSKRLPKKREPAYNQKVVIAFFAEHGIPVPDFEFTFHNERQWRFDLAWPMDNLALECDGGIWIQGGHNRGAQIKKTWEKENEANILGWHILKFEPNELCTDATAKMIKRALHL